MKCRFSDGKMEQMAAALKPLLVRRDICGYAAARNTRVLSEALTEYYDFKRELILQYGKKANGGYEVKPESENFDEFLSELEKIAAIEHEVEIMPIKYEDVIGYLSGEEILVLDDILEDEEV